MFATAELVSSDDFLSRLDVALTKHGRRAATPRRPAAAAAADARRSSLPSPRFLLP